MAPRSAANDRNGHLGQPNSFVPVGARWDALDMPYMPAGPPFDQFAATAEDVVRSRPELDPETVREIFAEVATVLHNGLVLDDLDGHDARAVVAGLCADLVTADPGAAVRARSSAVSGDPGDLHDPDAAAAAYLMAAQVLRL
jgi:hypothetical protein